jgi:acetyl-CoA C-acetyltransferase
MTGMDRGEILIAGACRTPIGNLQGALAGVPAPALGGHVIGEALLRANILPSAVGQVFMGQVLTAGAGQATARQAAWMGGLPEHVPATTVGKVCGSGLEAIILGCQTIVCGDADVVVAGGMESMSRAPYLLSKQHAATRTEWKVNELTDSMLLDGLSDAMTGQHMGLCIEEMVASYYFSREALDDFAVKSYSRALASVQHGAFDDETVPIRVTRQGPVMKEDERPRRFNEPKLRKLSPAFHPWGTVTAANASGTNDGASAMVLLSERRAQAVEAVPVARVLGYTRQAGAPARFATVQVEAVKTLLTKLGLGIDQIDLFEINEAFAAVPMAVMLELNIEPERVNVHGGAIALGHPIGASGARIVTTLLHALKRRNGRRGIATLCIGGGEGIALAVEML